MSGAIYFEDIELGHLFELGDHAFTEDEIISFATQWDPQPIHIDHAAAAAGPYEGITASGWQICAMWMKKMVAARKLWEKNKGNRASGGVSPGFLDLTWPAPVFAGDRITFTSQSFEKVELKSRPDLGILRSYSRAFNQDGVLVMQFTGQGMIGRRPKEE